MQSTLESIKHTCFLLSKCVLLACLFFCGSALLCSEKCQHFHPKVFVKRRMCTRNRVAARLGAEGEEEKTEGGEHLQTLSHLSEGKYRREGVV